MEMKFKEMLSQVTSFLEHEANTETVVGKPFKLGQFDCIPVVRIGMGFGSGGGGGDAPKSGHGEGGGAGAGMGIEPIGFLVAKEEKITFISTQTTKGLSAAFEKVPNLIEKYMDTKKEKAEPVEA
ncbi:MAG: sporulation protein [Saprospiraceae bacterium]|nr:sporulation protein [Saprospiraceae bacterium]